jgi:hypothetical protein
VAVSLAILRASSRCSDPGYETPSRIGNPTPTPPTQRGDRSSKLLKNGTRQVTARGFAVLPRSDELGRIAAKNAAGEATVWIALPGSTGELSDAAGWPEHGIALSELVAGALVDRPDPGTELKSFLARGFAPGSVRREVER